MESFGGGIPLPTTSVLTVVTHTPLGKLWNDGLLLTLVPLRTLIFEVVIPSCEAWRRASVPHMNMKKAEAHES